MRNLLISTILVSQVLAGCGSDDENARPRYQTGVTVTGSGSGPVANLSDPQLKRICDSYDAYVSTNIGFDQIAYIACLPVAIVLGGSTAGCKQRLADCMQSFPQPVSVQAHVHDPDVCFATLQQCQASVSVLENCVNVNLDLALDILDNWSCAGANDPDLQKDAAHAMDTVNVCGQANDACGQFATLGPD